MNAPARITAACEMAPCPPRTWVFAVGIGRFSYIGVSETPEVAANEYAAKCTGQARVAVLDGLYDGERLAKNMQTLWEREQLLPEEPLFACPIEALFEATRWISGVEWRNVLRF